MIRIESKSPEHTFRLGELLGQVLAAGDVVLLNGEMGAGKSVFARGVGTALGVREPMASPTFTLMQPYQARIPLYHFDLYRLESEDEFFEAGLDEFIEGDGVALVEWPQQTDLLPDRRIEVAIFPDDENENMRRVEFSFYGMDETQARMDNLLVDEEK